MFLLNSCLGSFSVTHLSGHPFSLSYGARLPSSLTKVVSIALEHSFLPTGVGLRYGRFYFTDNEDFLDGLGVHQIASDFSLTSPHLQLDIRSGFACSSIAFNG